MRPYLSKYFGSEEERINFHIYGDKQLDPRAAFIIGLDGMTCEEAMIKGQEGFGHLYSALCQSMRHWTENFKPTNEHFTSLWTQEEWTKLLHYEKEFIRIYRGLANWKHEPPKAPKRFSNEDYQELKKLTDELFDYLAK